MKGEMKAKWVNIRTLITKLITKPAPRTPNEAKNTGKVSLQPLVAMPTYQGPIPGGTFNK